MGAKERFIQDVLHEEGQKMLGYQTEQIARVTTSRTGNLRTNRYVRTSSDQLTLMHPIYERYLDMRKRRSSGKRKKSRKIHNRYVFGAYASIAERLMYGFTEEVAQQFRSLEGNVTSL